MMGECSQETAFSMLDYFYDMGGNFIDTANGYQAEESETWLGEWMAKTPGRRDEMVIATKYSASYKTMSEPHLQQSNFGGNSAKSLHVSVEQSLHKLQTSYIDLLYVHYWDLTASVAEVMQSLNHLVAAGKVLYLGVSDTPAWYVPFRSISDISLFLLVLVLALIFVLSVRLNLMLSRWGYQ
jgi:aryl-alcohol dehydrogenase-like predicted oxidoreductase